MSNVVNFSEYRRRKELGEPTHKELDKVLEVIGEDASNFSAIIADNAAKAIALNEKRLKHNKNLLKSLEFEDRRRKPTDKDKD